VSKGKYTTLISMTAVTNQGHSLTLLKKRLNSDTVNGLVKTCRDFTSWWDIICEDDFKSATLSYGPIVRETPSFPL